MPRRLISTDLDGTIVFNGTISLRDREAMARWRAAGNLLVINTGRSVSALEHVVVPMGLEFDNAILYTGAAIVDADIRVQCSTALPAGVVEDILDFVEGAPGVTVFTTGLDEDLLIYDTIGSGSELLTLFRPATRRELDGREVIGVPMRFTDSGNGHKVTVSFDESVFTNGVLWQQDAESFVCMEPWNGWANSVNEAGHHIELNPGESKEFKWSVTIG